MGITRAEVPYLSGGTGGDDPRKGPFRRWLNRVDRNVDDEVNRFFSPEEKSHTGELVDRYVERAEASLAKAGHAAKKTKTDLDTLGDDYTARIFGGGRKRPKSDRANIRWITRRPKTVVMAMLLVSMVMAVPALNIVGNEALGIDSQMRGDFEVFLPPDDPTTEIINEVREDWATDAMFLYGEMLSKENVTDVAILKALSAIEGDEDHPPPPMPPDGSGYQEDFDYLAYGLNPWREDDGELDGISAILSIPMLVKVINQTAQELAIRLGVGDVPGNYSIPNDQALIDRVLGQLPADVVRPIVADTDSDGIYDRFALIVLLNKDPDIQNKVMERTRLILDEVNKEWEGSMVIYLTGPTPLIQTIQERTLEEFFNVIGLVIIALMLALFIWHRTPWVIIIALMPVSLGLLVALGIIGALWQWVVITPQVVIVAPVLLALGVSYGLYISNRFAEEKEGTREERLSKAVKAINPAIMLSALTTGIGFASLMIGTLPPIFTMGLALTLGILFTYIMTYTLVPALIMITKYEKKRETAGMKTFSTIPSRNRKKIVLFSIIAVVLSISLIPAVRLDANYLAMAPADETVVVQMDEYSKYMGGGQMGLFILRDDPYEYSVLEIMDDTTNKVNQIENTQAMSMVGIMSSVSMPDEVTVGGITIGTAGLSFWEVVQTLSDLGADNAAQLMIDMWYDVLSYEPREMLISTESQRALIYTFMPFLDIDDTRAAVDGVNAVVAEQNELYNDPNLHSILTGIAAITLAVNDLIIASQFNSLAVCIALTFIVLAIIFRSIKIGFLTIIPVLCVIALEPGTMVALDIPLSTITVMIGSIAIGTGVDYSIQISQRIRLGGYTLPAVFNAVEKAGTSFVEATTTMLLGFAMCLFIQIDSIQEFVIMIMVLMAYNAIFALVVLPAVYTIYIRRQEAKEAKMKAKPKKGPSTRRTRYESIIKKIFRIRDEPADLFTPRQTALPLEMESIEEKSEE